MAETYGVVITGVLTFFGVVAVWFLLPERIRMLVRLRSDAKLLLWKVQLLQRLKDNLKERADYLLSDESKVLSSVAKNWFDMVDELCGEYELLEMFFMSRMQIIWWCSHLVKKVNDGLVRVKEVMEMRNSFKDEDLVTDGPEFIRLVTTVGEKVRSVENVKKHLERTKGYLEMKIKALENDGRQRDGRVSAWFGETQECLHSFQEAFPGYSSIIKRPCQQTCSANSSSSFCSSNAIACVACQGKYALSKEVERLIGLYNDLRDEGFGYFGNAQNCVGPVLELLVVLGKLETNCIALIGLKENLENIKHRMENRVCSTLESFQQSGMKMECSSKVRRWLKDVESAITSSSKASHKWHYIRNEASPCSRKCCYILEACEACSCRYTLSKEVEGLLQELQQLKEEANDDHFKDADKLVVQVKLADVELIPIYSKKVFGQEEELKETLKLIEEEDSTGVVVICGMGGIGKTTLLKRINNHFVNKSATSSFDVVIFTTVDRNNSNNILKMQRDIGNRLGIFQTETWNERLGIFHSEIGDEHNNAKQIFESLRSKSFLLLLDDMWKEIDLEKLGIPPLNSSSMEGRELLQQQKKQKLVITTRNRSICYGMGSGIVELGLLSHEMSWQLFCKYVNNDQLFKENSEVAALAKDVANECNRLPLALVTVGKAMSGSVEAFEWRTAKKELQRSVFPPMKEKVLLRLKFSFDSLE